MSGTIALVIVVGLGVASVWLLSRSWRSTARRRDGRDR